MRKKENVKTDKWFYELFLSQPGMLAELIPGVETSWQFSYSAVVVKEKAFEFDGVFTLFLIYVTVIYLSVRKFLTVL